MKNVRSKLIILIIFLLCTNEIYCETQRDSVITDETSNRILTLINNNYKIFEANIIHQDINKLILNDINSLIEDYNDYTQTELDIQALKIFDNLYKNVNLGSLNDSNDYRRQSMRAAICFATIGLCSESNYSYYLDLSDKTLKENQQPIEFLENFYLSQLLVNIYIYNLKNSEHGIRMSVMAYRSMINNSNFRSTYQESVEELIIAIEEMLGESKK